MLREASLFMAQGGAASRKKVHIVSRIVLWNTPEYSFPTPNGISEGKFGGSKFFAHYEMDLQNFSPTTNRGYLPTSSSVIARETTISAFLALQNFSPTTKQTSKIIRPL